jgi:hypothetical protein
LEEKLSNKLKNGHENFSGVRVSMILRLLTGIYSKNMRFRDSQGRLTWQKNFMILLELIGQFSFQNNIFQLQEVFSML